MSGIRTINSQSGTTGLRACTPTSVDIQHDTADHLLKYKDDAGTVQVVPTRAVPGTLVSPTLTTPTLTSPTVTGDASSGIVVAKTIAFAETAAGLSHVGSVTLPAGAVLLDILVSAGVLWGAAAAVLKVGDTADDDGYFIGVDLKATDLLVGEVLSVSGSTGNWGGKNGAYLVAASGRRGPAATNFGAHYAAGSIITATITVTTPTPTTGRTFVTVFYAVGQAVAPVIT